MNFATSVCSGGWWREAQHPALPVDWRSLPGQGFETLHPHTLELSCIEHKMMRLRFPLGFPQEFAHSANLLSAPFAGHYELGGQIQTHASLFSQSLLVEERGINQVIFEWVCNY